MILGIGIDLADIRRIEHSIETFGTRFLMRVLTPAEQEYAKTRKASGRFAETVATRFAAKEACAKALGCGFAKGVGFQGMEIGHGALGEPILTLKNGAALRLKSLTPDQHVARIHVSLTNTHPWAFAQVLLEAVPDS